MSLSNLIVIAISVIVVSILAADIPIQTQTHATQLTMEDSKLNDEVIVIGVAGGSGAGKVRLC